MFDIGMVVQFSFCEKEILAFTATVLAKAIFKTDGQIWMKCFVMDFGIFRMFENLITIAAGYVERCSWFVRLLNLFQGFSNSGSVSM